MLYLAIFKLTSGEEIVGRLEDEDSSQVSISRPMSIVPGPNGVAIAPCMMGADQEENVTLYTSAIAMRGKVHPELERAYTQAVSGLYVPKPTPQPNVLMGFTGGGRK